MNFKNHSEIELNLAPIIDCFTVLIMFLLISASFLSIGIFDTGVSATESTSTQNSHSSDVIQIELRALHSFHVSVSGQSFELPAKNSEWDYEGLLLKLSGYKNPDLTVILSAKNEIEYNHIIRTLDRLRPTFKNVVLGGF